MPWRSLLLFMKLQKACVFKKNFIHFHSQKVKEGFTVVEIMLVLGLVAVLASVLTPITLNFYRSEQLDAHTGAVVQALRRAQIQSMNLEDDSSFGVRFDFGEYVLFKGVSYLKREQDYDEIFKLPQGFSLDGLSEVVFSKIRGIPSDAGEIVLTIATQRAVISINEMGVVHY